MAGRGWIVPFLCVFLTVGCARKGSHDQDSQAFDQRPTKQFDEPYATAYGARRNQRPQPPPVSDKWLEILDREIKANGGKIPIDPEISVVVDREGSGKEYFQPATEREKAYADVFIKLRSLATSLYRTEEGRAAYLELFNPNFLIRLADRLDFDLSDSRRVNLRDRKFVPQDLPVLLEYIHHNMTYVLNLEPDFTKTYGAFGSEDDTKNYDPAAEKNELFKMVNGKSNGQTVRVNFSEKLGQMSLLTTWLIEGNAEYLREDGSDPGRNLWFLDDERVFPDSMRAVMFTQFDPAEAVRELAAINRDLEKGENLSKAQIDKITQGYRAVAHVWKTTVEVVRADGGLESMFEEFPYLRPVVTRYEGDPALGVEGEICKFERLARTRGIQRR